MILDKPDNHKAAISYFETSTLKLFTQAQNKHFLPSLHKPIANANFTLIGRTNNNHK